MTDNQPVHHVFKHAQEEDFKILELKTSSIPYILAPLLFKK